MRTVIIGMGNRLLADDAVGCFVAERLSHHLAAADSVVCRELPAGGIRLMEAMAGFDRAIIVDAVETGSMAPGSIVEVSAVELSETRNTASSHDGTLAEAMELGRQAGLDLPSDIRIWGIEAADTMSFGAPLSLPVERAAEEIATRIANDLLERDS